MCVMNADIAVMMHAIPIVMGRNAGTTDVVSHVVSATQAAPANLEPAPLIIPAHPTARRSNVVTTDAMEPAANATRAKFALWMGSARPT